MFDIGIYQIVHTQNIIRILNEQTGNMFGCNKKNLASYTKNWLKKKQVSNKKEREGQVKSIHEKH